MYSRSAYTGRTAASGSLNKVHMQTISFVILTWNSEKTITDTLEGIRATCAEETIPYEVIVVDNGSNDATIRIIEEVSQEMPLEIVRLDRNFGTTITRNTGIRKSKGDIICVIDSDAVLVSGSLAKLCRTLTDDRSIGILAPKLVFPDGAIQVSVKHFPSLIGKLSKIPGIILKIPFRDIDGYDSFPFEGPRDVDSAISACWFFRRDLIDVIGYLDERIFYAPEDVDFCLRVWKHGLRTVYYTDFTVIHHVQRITHKKFFGRIAASHLLGLMYYFLKHRYIIKPSKR